MTGDAGAADSTSDNSGKFASVEKILNDGVEGGVFPGAVLIVGLSGQELYRKAVGYRTLRTSRSEDALPMAEEMVFDVAQLTSSVVTTTLIMKLVEAGKLKLEDKVTRFVQGFSVYNKSAISIGHLLNHSSGLPQWIPFFEELLKANAGGRMGVMTSRGARDEVISAIVRTQLKHETGSRQLYSDLGPILLGHICEILTGFSLDKSAAQHVFQPLGLKTSSYIDLSMIKRRGIHPVQDLIAPTESCDWRKRILCGEVHDDNAWAMGGIAGHAGLFSTAGDLHLFAAEMLAVWRGESSYLKAETLRRFWRSSDRIDDGSWQYGWDTPGRENGMGESRLSPQALGQCGFTGCSLWLEPEMGVDVVLMTNRIYPSRNNRKIRSFRPQLHDAVLEVLRVGTE